MLQLIIGQNFQIFFLVDYDLSTAKKANIEGYGSQKTKKNFLTWFAKINKQISIQTIC